MQFISVQPFQHTRTHLLYEYIHTCIPAFVHTVSTHGTYRRCTHCTYSTWDSAIASKCSICNPVAKAAGPLLVSAIENPTAVTDGGQKFNTEQTGPVRRRTLTVRYGEITVRRRARPCLRASCFKMRHGLNGSHILASSHPRECFPPCPPLFRRCPSERADLRAGISRLGDRPDSAKLRRDRLR